LADRVHLTITDTGSWKTPSSVKNTTRGRGIALMRGLMQEVAIKPESAGTTVHLTARIA
jgi:anti-sigma regulatory factor (Ser/Thr protein kinase)